MKKERMTYHKRLTMLLELALDLVKRDPVKARELDALSLEEVETYLKNMQTDEEHEPDPNAQRRVNQNEQV